MTDPTRNSLARLTTLSQALNNISDQLTHNIAEIENALVALNLGLWAWVKDDPLSVEELTVTTKDGKPAVAHHVQQLGYGKHNGKWAFLVASGIQEKWEEDAKIELLRNCPRQVKLAAVDRIPKLVESFAEELTRVTDEVTQKASEAMSIAVALGAR
jgi:hypothetical protein